MTPTCLSISSGLKKLTELSAFVWVLDENLSITWASDAVVRYMNNAVGRNMGDILEIKEPSLPLSFSSIIENIDTPYRVKFLFKNRFIPLTGVWVILHENIIFMARPDVGEEYENIDEFSLNDFADNDPTIALMTRRFEFDAALREEREVKAALQESVNRYKTLFMTSRDAMMTLAPPSWFFTSCNPRTLELFCAKDEEEFKSKGPWDVSPESQPDGMPSSERSKLFITKAMEEGSCLFDWTHRCLNGENFFATVLLTRMIIDGQPVLQATVRDITEQKNLEMELRSAQKLESVGQLAAGIAHEINTPIQFVGDNLRFLRDSISDLLDLSEKYEELIETLKKKEDVSAEDLAEHEKVLEDADLDYLKEELPKAIDQSLDGSGRVSKIVRAMKEFSHPGSRELVNTNINEAIETTITVARSEWKYVAEMRTELDPDLPMVPCLVSEFNQVILNMIVNARDAIEEFNASNEKDADSNAAGAPVNVGTSAKGTITISTTLSKGFAEIRVSDTGAGMSADVKNHIFDPFFTTKEIGKGSGQGLAIAYSVIVDKHHGKLSVESDPGSGTTFIIQLPLN